jgi:hypothetical protein
MRADRSHVRRVARDNASLPLVRHWPPRRARSCAIASAWALTCAAASAAPRPRAESNVLVPRAMSAFVRGGGLITLHGQESRAELGVLYPQDQGRIREGRLRCHCGE